MKKEEYYLSLHKYGHIWWGRDFANGTHICQIRPRSKGRRKLKRTSETAIKQAVIDFYKDWEKQGKREKN